MTGNSAGVAAHQQLTLRALLDEPLLRRATLFAADQDLDRPVEWCLPWSVAVTGTGMITGVLVHGEAALPAHDPVALGRSVAALAQRRCAALAVDSAAGVPAALREAAREHRLPVVALPAPASYLALSKLIAEKTLAFEAHVMKYGVRVHQALSEVLYQGAGLTAMARQISRLAGCPVLVLDSRFTVLAQEQPQAPLPMPETDVIAQLREHASRGGQQQAAGGRGHAAAVQLTSGEGPVTAVVAPIILGGTTYGWVVLVELAHPPHRHDLAQHLVIAEQGATITGSEMLRLRSVMAAEERARGDFLHALLYGRFAGPHELTARASHYGFVTDAPYGVIVIQLPYPGTDSGLERHAATLRGIQRLPSMSGREALSTMIGDMLVVVTRVGTGRGTRNVRAEQDTLAGCAHALARELRSHTDRLGCVAYGRPGAGGPGVAGSYRDARLALAVAQRLGLGEVCGYSELRVYAVLLGLADNRQALAFAGEVLEPIRRPGESEGMPLEQVVLAFIESGANLNAAARKLHLHRNTMSYKLGRASRLMRMDLRDPDTLFTIWLAHRIDLLHQVQSDLSAEMSPLSSLIAPGEDGRDGPPGEGFLS